MGLTGKEVNRATRLLHVASGQWISRAISTAAEIGVADLLKDGAKDCKELAAALGGREEVLYRLMRALANVGVFAEREDGRFEMNSLAECLQKDAPDSIRDFAIMLGKEWHWKSWGNFKESVVTGRSAFEMANGMNLYQYLSAYPEDEQIFYRAMGSLTRRTAPAITRAYEFSSFRTIVDLGGGHGTFLAMILRLYPEMNGVLFDRLSVIEQAKKYLEQERVSDRCMFVPGDLLETAPAGGDVYFLKHVLRTWDDERAAIILRNCRNAMKPGAILLVAEMVIPEGNEPFWGKLVDLEMLVMYPGGRERTGREYKSLLEKGGFELSRVIETSNPISILEARPA